MNKVRVKATLLNKRRQLPVSFPETENIVGTVVAGYEFEAEEVTNPFNPALGKWYRDLEGYFYWAGGLEEVFHQAEKMSWGHKWYQIPSIWSDINSKGEGVVVAIIDTGADLDHSDLSPNILQDLSKSFVTDTIGCEDEHGHGTSMAGIIAACGNNLYGVAPRSKLVIIKGSRYQYGVNADEFASAIEYAGTIPEVDIISISYAFTIENNKIKAAIQKCQVNNKIIVSAIGNYRNSNQASDGDTYPAGYNTDIAVGAFDMNGSICNFSNWNPHLDMLSPGDALMLTTGLNNTIINEGGTSIAAAFTVGCLALMVSFAKKKGKSAASCVQFLKDTCDDIGPNIGKDLMSGHGRLNLRNAISKLKI